MKLVLPRTAADCGIAAAATLLEQSYEDVYVEAARVDRKHRGRSGMYFPTLIRIGKAMGARLVRQRRPVEFEDDEGLLVVTWSPGSRHEVGGAHLVALGHGVFRSGRWGGPAGR